MNYYGDGVEKLNKSEIEEPVLKARILLAFTLGVDKEYLVIHDNDEVDIVKEKQFRDGISKLINHVPLQHITHHQEFMKLNFYVDENVLIPRADTEILVEEVINYCSKNIKKNYKILDLCTGSGAIGIAIAKYLNNAYITCADISENAIEIARENANRNKVTNIEFLQSNMFETVKDKFDIIVSNPPYIKKDVISELDKEVQHEPILALDGGIDGLDFYRIIINKSHDYTKNNGRLFLEIGYDQKDEVTSLLKKDGRYKDIYSKRDLGGNDRILCAKT